MPTAKKPFPGYIEYGSDEHKAMIGLVKTQDPEERAKLEEQLKVKPEVVSKRRPIAEALPQTRNERGDDIIDGWRRRGR